MARKTSTCSVHSPHLMIEMCPRLHAEWSGVLERSSRALTKAPDDRRVRTMSSFPACKPVVVEYYVQVLD